MAYKNKEERAAYMAKYCAAHRKERAAYRASQRKKNAAYKDAHRKENAAYRAAHRKEERARKAAYNAAHPEIIARTYFTRYLGLKKDEIPPAALKLKTAIIAHARELKSLKGEKHA